MGSQHFPHGDDNHSQMIRLEMLRKSLIDKQQLEGKDPMIPHDIYAPSGMDVLNMLIQIRGRPRPIVTIGAVDTNVALVLVDADLPDHPIIYYTEHFSRLTGYYDQTELVGRNCRFLQYPPPGQAPAEDVEAMNTVARNHLKQMVQEFKEAQVDIVNYKKDGKQFINVLTIIPFLWKNANDGTTKRYILGFQADKADLHG